MDTIKKLDKYFAENFDQEDSMPIRPLIICKDGFSMSIQASWGHYSSPRTTMRNGYYEYEVGFPSEKENLLMKHVEQWDEKDDPRHCVYPYSPAETVAEVINKHGGFIFNPQPILDQCTECTKKDFIFLWHRLLHSLWLFPLKVRYLKPLEIARDYLRKKNSKLYYKLYRYSLAHLSSKKRFKHNKMMRNRSRFFIKNLVLCGHCSCQK